MEPFLPRMDIKKLRGLADGFLQREASVCDGVHVL
jgi:hypothetical protein